MPYNRILARETCRGATDSVDLYEERDAEQEERVGTDIISAIDYAQPGQCCLLGYSASTTLPVPLELTSFQIHSRSVSTHPRPYATFAMAMDKTKLEKTVRDFTELAKHRHHFIGNLTSVIAWGIPTYLDNSSSAGFDLLTSRLPNEMTHIQQNYIDRFFKDILAEAKTPATPNSIQRIERCEVFGSANIIAAMARLTKKRYGLKSERDFLSDLVKTSFRLQDLLGYDLRGGGEGHSRLEGRGTGDIVQEGIRRAPWKHRRYDAAYLVYITDANLMQEMKQPPCRQMGILSFSPR